jgi:N-acetylmuramoyl-L-alanine amidase
MVPRFITVHNTDNTNKGADALGHAAFIKGSAAGSTSWHYTVDDKRIVQHIPTNEVAYHAGDGAYGPGNSTSIGIEICMNSDCDYPKAEANAVDLIRYLMVSEHIGIEGVVPHKHWIDKNCPSQILPRWDQFIITIQQGMKPANTVEYVVQKGDYMRKIADYFNVTVDEIIKVNPQILEPSVLSVEEIIYIPIKIDPLAEVPGCARPSVQKAMKKGVVTQPTGDETFYRLMVVLDKLTLFN